MTAAWKYYTTECEKEKCKKKKCMHNIKKNCTLRSMSFTIRRVRETPSTLQKQRRWITMITAIKAMIHAWQKRRETQQETMHSPSTRLRRVALMLCATLIALLLFGGIVFGTGIAKNILIQILSFQSTTLPSDKQGHINILLLGEGNKNHDGIDLTDTIMVASIDPIHHEAPALLSLPRDTYVMKAGVMGNGRINSLYRDYKAQLIKEGIAEEEASTQSMKELEKTIGMLIGQEIHRSIKINFSGFIEAIDAIEGIEMTLEKPFIDTAYPSDAEDGYTTFSLPAGTQILDGKTALKFARSRHSTSDFSRSARQQKIIEAIVKKMKEAGITTNMSRIQSLHNILENNIETTMTMNEILMLAAIGAKMPSTEMITMQLNDQNGLYGSLSMRGGFLYAPPREEFHGAAVLLPVSIPEFPVTWRQIQHLTSLLFEKRTWLSVNAPRIVILNAGAAPGSAGTLGIELEKYGFRIEKTRNISKDPAQKFARSMIVSQEGHPQTQELSAFLQSTLRINGAEERIENVFEPENADIAIILGKDFSYKPLQNLLPTPH
jgi:polyisoprenyl-teichoic acid--peptidoglycan teichoic acid transferase